MLEVRNLAKEFDGIRAVDDLSFSVERGEILGIIGPNGSGKTTTVNLICGAFNPTKGSVLFNGKRIDGLPAHAIAQKGIGRTFQVTQVFQRMTVFENMMVPALATSQGRSKDELAKRALRQLDFLKIGRLKAEYARNLSGGQQKLLELGRVLMLEPQLIILDEPFAGVHPELKGEIHRYIRTMNKEGSTFILISHDLQTIFHLCHRLVVLAQGQKIADAPPEQVRTNERFIEAYLGE